MCRILFKPTNDVNFDKNVLQESYKDNPDGTGLIYYDLSLDQMVCQKWTSDTQFDTIWKTVQSVEKNKSACNIAIHFRYGTSGGKGIDQIHPIHVCDNLWLIHNGICHDFEFDNRVMSDTQLMAFWFKCSGITISDMKARLGKLYLNDKFASNKLLFIERQNYHIINEELGSWENGIWSSWQPCESTIFDDNQYGLTQIRRDLDEEEEEDEVEEVNNWNRSFA
ncbi:MAG: hypothetical protein LBV37_01705 [Mycoplasmataceae bacterium]|nr:hypothetical protein [Mycoplasmataceae bacterium]